MSRLNTRVKVNDMAGEGTLSPVGGSDNTCDVSQVPGKCFDRFNCNVKRLPLEAVKVYRFILGIVCLSLLAYYIYLLANKMIGWHEYGFLSALTLALSLAFAGFAQDQGKPEDE